ncbi:hypothetical protein GW916_02695 [bacterium]|nr:hypothetical protein [bacterium]
MAWVIKTLLKVVAVRELKRKGELFALQFLNGLRRAMRLSFFIIILSQIFLCGLGLTIYSLLQLLPIDENMKLYAMLGVGLFLVIVPLSLLLWSTSDHLWYQIYRSRKS